MHSVFAFFVSNGTDSNGHNTSWTISINLAYGVSSSTAAHEIGHAIGLIDLFSASNTSQLMYYTESRSATVPSSYDKWGAKVILGIHSTHNWGYRYYGNLPSGSRHIKYCTQCNGNSLTIEYCTYNNLGICTKCGSSNSVQPW